MTKFDNDRNLGAVVSSWTTFSEIGNKPVTDKRQLTIAGGRHKMSRLCGFVFTAKTGDQFAMTFICKLRSKINRLQKKQIGGQWTIPSRWFFLTRSGQNTLSVFSKSKAMEQYGFDVDKFFDSDLFATETPKLLKLVKNGLQQARKFAESLKNDEDRRLAIEEVSSIELSIPLIKEDRFEDRSYLLTNYEIKEQEDMTNEASFDQYDWKDGSITGDGLIKMIKDSGTGKQNTLKAPVRIYDRATNKYFDILDSHLGKKNTGMMLEIDTSKTVSENELHKNMNNEAIDKSSDSANFKITNDMMSANGKSISPNGLVLLVKELKKHNIGSEFNNVIITDKRLSSFKNVVGAYPVPYDGGLALIIDDKNVKATESDKQNSLEEANDSDPISHALDIVGVKASTANSAGQDAIEMAIIEKELDEKINQELKKKGIYADLNENDDKSAEAINKVEQDAKKLNKKDIEKIIKKTEEKAKDPESKSLFKKVKDLLNLTYSMIKDTITGQYKMQFSTLCIFASALAYVISPVDLIPDYLPVVGQIDDAAVLTWLFKAYADEIENYNKGK